MSRDFDMKFESTKEIIQDAAALPFKERIIVIDSLLRTLNIPNDTAWLEIAKRRLSEIRSNRIKPIPGD